MVAGILGASSLLGKRKECTDLDETARKRKFNYFLRSDLDLTLINSDLKDEELKSDQYTGRVYTMKWSEVIPGGTEEEFIRHSVAAKGLKEFLVWVFIFK
jgi:hypothetical protein